MTRASLWVAVGSAGLLVIGSVIQAASDLRAYDKVMEALGLGDIVKGYLKRAFIPVIGYVYLFREAGKMIEKIKEKQAAGDADAREVARFAWSFLGWYYVCFGALAGLVAAALALMSG
jgi:hypothetical protein